jgi:hypothetical protein
MIDYFIATLPAIVMVLYFITGGLLLFKGEYYDSGLWCCYGIANLFLILMGLQKAGILE